MSESDVRTDDEIRKGDADFRRKLAFRLYVLFFTAIMLGPIMILTGVLIEIFIPEKMEFAALLEHSTLLATSIIGTVAGVFGTVMGFYYGTEKT